MSTGVRWGRSVAALGALVLLSSAFVTLPTVARAASPGSTSADTATEAPAAPVTCTLRHDPRATVDEFASCVQVDVALSRLPAVGQRATVTVTVQSQVDRPAATLTLDLTPGLRLDAAPEGATTTAATDGAGPLQRVTSTVALARDGVITRTFAVTPTTVGELTLRATILAPSPTGADSSSDAVHLTVGAAGAVEGFAADTGVQATAPAPAGVVAEEPVKPLPAASVEQPALAPEVGGTTCAVGGWIYFDADEAQRPAVNWVVQAYDTDTGSGPDYLAGGFTSGTGEYRLCFTNTDDEGGGVDLYVRFTGSNARWQVMNAGSVMTFATGTVANAPDGDVSFGTLTPADHALQRGLSAYDSVNKAWYWTPTGAAACWDADDAAAACRQVTVHWSPSSTDGTYYDMENGVHLAAADPDSRHTVIHELGHFVMDDVYEDAFPPSPSCNPHYVTGVSSAGCAWTEGFAEWYPAMVLRDKAYRWPDGGWVDLEGATWRTADWADGEVVEGRVAGALIDLADAANEAPYDRFSDGDWAPGATWDLLLGPHPATMSGYWTLRGASGYDVADTGGRASLYQNTIDYGFADPLTGYAELGRPYPPPSGHDYVAAVTPAFWTAVGLRPASGDVDLEVYDTGKGVGYLTGSSYGGTTTDYVVVDSNLRATPDDVYPRAVPFTEGAGYTIELAGSAMCNGTRTLAFSATDVLFICDALLAAGETMTFRFVPAATSDVDLYLHVSTPGAPLTYVQSLGAAVVWSTTDGVGTPETLTFTSTINQWDGLVLVNRAGSGSGTLYVDSTGPSGSILLAGGAAKTPTTAVTATLSATDAQTGLDAMQVSLDGVFDTEPVVAYTTSRAVTLPGGDGLKTVWARYRNHAGLWSATVSDTITLDTRADLVVDALTVPTVGVAGMALTITDTTKNLGPSAAAKSTTTYWLSTDLVVGAGDVVLSTRSVPALVSGASSTATKKPVLPDVAGAYWILACADAAGVVAERDETDNCRAAPITVERRADMKINAVGRPPATLHAGASFTANDTTKNAGLGPAPASKTKYYLSLDEVRDASDVILAGVRLVPALAAGATSAGSLQVTVPAATPPGTYYLLAAADYGNLVAEMKEGNNTRASVTTVVIS